VLPPVDSPKPEPVDDPGNQEAKQIGLSEKERKRPLNVVNIKEVGI